MGDIDQTTWKDLLEELIKEALPRMPGGITIRGKSALFIDNIAKVAYKVAQKYNEMHGGDLERQFANILRYMIDEIATHEFVHTALEKPAQVPKKIWEAYIQRAASKLAREMTRVDWMVWSRIPCPKRNGQEVTFSECLNCSDEEKAAECPLWSIRKTFMPRMTDDHIYHASELPYPRFSYYNRTLGHSAFWDEYSFDLWFGSAGHEYIQKGFPKAQCEIFVYWDLGDIKIVGSIDAYDPIHRILFEFKTIKSLYFVLKRDQPEEDHLLQAQIYVKLAEMSQPWIRPEKIKIIYVAKIRLDSARAEQRYKEFTLKPDPPQDLAESARSLDRAFVTGTPPKSKCPAWKCKECKYHKKCEEDGWK